VSLVLNAYNRAVYSLMIMKPPKHVSRPNKTKMKTVYHTQRQMRVPPLNLPLKQTPLKLNQLSPNSRRKAFQSVRKKANTYSTELSPLALALNSVHKNSDNLLLLTIATGYSGVVGPYTNHPNHFILPSVTTLQSNSRPAKPEPSSSHLLVWSTEKCGAEDDGGGEDLYEPSEEDT
jgi:hypothetical protein